VIAKRLLDHAKLRGFAFRRAVPGADGPLIGKRTGDAWVDIIHIAGFSRDCLAVRQRTLSLILLGNELVNRPSGGQRARRAQQSKARALRSPLARIHWLTLSDHFM
jgi:hypothetical protein